MKFFVLHDIQTQDGIQQPFQSRSDLQEKNLFPCGGRLGVGQVGDAGRWEAPARACARLACTGLAVAVACAGDRLQGPWRGRSAGRLAVLSQLPRGAKRQHHQVRRDAMRFVDVLCFWLCPAVPRCSSARVPACPRHYCHLCVRRRLLLTHAGWRNRRTTQAQRRPLEARLAAEDQETLVLGTQPCCLREPVYGHFAVKASVRDTGVGARRATQRRSLKRSHSFTRHEAWQPRLPLGCRRAGFLPRDD